MKRFAPFFAALAAFLLICTLAGCIYYVPREDSASGTVPASRETSTALRTDSASSDAGETEPASAEPESGWSRRY